MVPWIKSFFKLVFFTIIVFLWQLETTWRDLNIYFKFQLATRELIFFLKNNYLCNLMYNRSWWTNIKHSFYSNAKFKIIIIISARAFAFIVCTSFSFILGKCLEMFMKYWIYNFRIINWKWRNVQIYSNLKPY